MSMMIGIEFAHARSDFVAPLWETARNLRDDELRGTVARWLKRLSDSYNLDLPGMEELLEMEDVTVLTSRLDETIEEWRRDAVAEGVAQERVLLRRQTARRFGRETAERIDALLAGVTDWDLLGSVGEWIIDAQTGVELTDRVAALVRRQL